MFHVNDADRVLQFDGEHLAFATSQRPGVDRWAEFSLYRTVSGTYVVSRVGRSRIYHTLGCSILRKGKQSAVAAATLGAGAVACIECWSPTELAEIAPNHPVYPERSIYWAQTCTTASAMVETLARYDKDGNRYLTHVARDLLRDAAKLDTDLNDAYYVETIR